MCWFVEFFVEMMDARPDTVKRIENKINGYRIPNERRPLEKVQFVRGTVADGFHTALHCDCGFVNEHNAPEWDRHSLDHYPDLFKTILMQPGVKNIKVAWYWSEEKPKEIEEKLTISEFLRKNEARDLSSLVKYKIIKEKYF